MPRDRYSDFLADPLVEETFESEARLDGTENAFLERSYGEDLYVPEVLKNEEYSDSPDVLFRERINLEHQRRRQLRQAEEAFQNTNEREKFRKALSESVSAWSKNIPGGGMVSTFVDFSVFMDRMLSLPKKAVTEFGLKAVAGTLEFAMSLPSSPGVGAPGLRRPELIEKAKQPFDEDPLLKSIESSIENLAEDYGVSPTYAASTFGKFTSMATQLGAGIGISLVNPAIAASVFSSSSYKEAVDIYDEFAENPNPEDRIKAGLMVAIPTLIATRLGGEASIAKFLTKMTPSTRKQLLGQVLGNSLKEAAGEQGELLAMRFMMNRMTSLDVDYFDKENLTNAIISLVAAGGFQSGKLFSGMSGNLKSVLDGENFSQRSFKQLTRNIDQAEFTSGIENPAIKAIAVEAFNGNVEAQQTLSSLFDLDQLHAKEEVSKESKIVESIKDQPKAGEAVELKTTEPELEVAKPTTAEAPKADPKSSATQRGVSTEPTYKKIIPELKGKVLDYGAGEGVGTNTMSKSGLEVTSHEPFPDKWKGETPPDFATPESASEIPSNSFDSIVSFSVLNVVKKDVRDFIVENIGRALAPSGKAYITARTPSDVKKAKTKSPVEGEENAFVIGKGEKTTFQKGFTQSELEAYVKETLGDGFEVKKKTGLSGSSIEITKIATKPETKTKPFDAGEVKLAQEQIKLDRENLGLEEMDGPTKRKWQDLNAQAKEQRLDLRAMDLVNELEKSPRVITDLEHSSLLIKEADLRNKYDEALDQTRKLQDQGKFEQSAVLNKKADDILVDIDRLLIASAKSGTEAGRALAARRMSVSRDDFSVTNMTIVAKANKKSDLTLEEKEQIKQVSKQVNDAKKEVDRVVKRNNEALRSGDPEADLPDSEFNSKVNREAKLNKNSKTRSRVKLLEKELEIVRQRFVDKESPKEVEKRKPTKKEQELLDKIAFYKKGEAEAGRIAVLEEKLERFSNLEKKGDIESIRQEVGKPPKWVSKKEVETYENKLKDVVNKKRKRLRKEVSDADKQNLVTELAGAYAGYKIEAKKARRLQESYLKWTAGRIWNEAVALPRALMVTGDAGAVFRQGLIASVRRPSVAAKSQVKAFASALNERKFFEIDSMLKEVDPEAHALRDQAGLYLADPSQRGLNSREEAFTSRWIENIWAIKHVAAASERHMTTTLNQLRAGAFDQFVAKHPNSTLEQRKAYANFINNATGRGSLGSLERSINGLNKVFFAPRYAASRFTAPILPGVYLAKKSTRLAGREALYDWAALIGIAGTVLALADVAGADVSYDPDSPDFLKIRIGNTRIDFLAGIAQSVRMMAMGPKAFTERQLNEDNRENLFNAYSKFFTYKLSPGVTIPITAMGGANVIGQDQDLVDQAISALPLVYTEAYQVWQNEDSLSLGAATAGLGFFGIGIQNYERKN